MERLVRLGCGLAVRLVRLGCGLHLVRLGCGQVERLVQHGCGLMQRLMQLALQEARETLGQREGSSTGRGEREGSRMVRVGREV